MTTDADGAEAVRRARRSVAAAVGATVPGPVPPAGGPFATPCGVFVTLRRHPSGALRGCIGYPLPHYPLGVALDRAARSAALDDPRFPPLAPPDLDRVTVEVSVLTVPEPIPPGPPGAIAAAVRVGRDGLIVEGRGGSGLLLPQVASEQGWSAEELLDGTCEKAGLPPGSWREAGVRVYRFSAEVFAERRPNGPVERAPLTPADGRPAPRT